MKIVVRGWAHVPVDRFFRVDEEVWFQFHSTKLQKSTSDNSKFWHYQSISSIYAISTNSIISQIYFSLVLFAYDLVIFSKKK